jgi:hypothetical protein
LSSIYGVEISSAHPLTLVQLSLPNRDGYIAARRGGRDLGESNSAVFYRAVSLHLGGLTVDVLLRIVVGTHLGADFKPSKGR